MKRVSLVNFLIAFSAAGASIPSLAWILLSAEQFLSVECPVRRVFVLEIHKHITAFRKTLYLARDSLASLGRITFPAQPQVSEIGRLHVRRFDLLALRFAKRAVFPPQRRENIFAKPGFVPE